MATHVRIYTDGACLGNPGPGGYAALLIFTDGRRVVIKGSERYTTNNRMELTALIKALEYLDDDSYDIDVYTDSQYLRTGLTEWVHRWVKNDWKTSYGKNVSNRDLWVELLRYMKKHTVKLHWIRGHSGHPENEYVDKIARQMAKEEGRKYKHPDLEY